MNKPQGYDQAVASGGFKSITAGTHKVKILKAIDTKSKAGQPMLVLNCDIADGEFKDYYRKAYDYKKQNYGSATWGCIIRKLCDEDDKKTIGYFKGMMTAIENSNPGYVWDDTWDENTLRNKVACGVFDYDKPWQNDKGEMVQTVKIQSLRSIDMLGKVEPKGKQEIKPPFGKSNREAPPEQNKEWNITDEELPF